MARKRARDLVPLAESWLRPAEMTVKGKGATSAGFEVLDRAYRVDCGTATALTSSFEASKSSPFVTLALILRGRAGDAKPVLAIDGTEIAPGKDYRFGQGATLDSTDLIPWRGIEAEQPLTVTIGAEAEKPKARRDAPPVHPALIALGVSPRASPFFAIQRGPPYPDPARALCPMGSQPNGMRAHMVIPGALTLKHPSVDPTWVPQDRNVWFKATLPNVSQGFASHSLGRKTRPIVPASSLRAGSGFHPARRMALSGA